MNGPVSGLYEDLATGNVLRLDVDRQFPLMRASGTFATFVQNIDWLAELVEVADRQWQGTVVFRNPDGAFLPFSTMTITVSGSEAAGNLTATVTFEGAGTNQTTATYAFRSPFFHPVELEYDMVAGTTTVTSINTHDHPNRPATLPNETLTIEEVYRRAGFDVTVSTDPDDTVPINFATTTGEAIEDRQLWDDNELHDAMQSFWSRFESRAQWALWVVFAELHEADEPSFLNPNPQPEDLGGIMFDSIGPNERQGTAIFNESFIKDAPAGDLAPAAWVRRMRFWTAVHEAGHAFNLAHAWQKHLGTRWRPISSDDEARSFMNYPFRVNGGQTEFFSDFEFRFIEQELEFLRHAPERFVQMGNADFFDNHGFQRLPTVASDKLTLEVRVNRPRAEFEFLEPVTIELKLKNVSDNPQLVDLCLLRDIEHMTVILKKDGRPARRFVPFARHCWSGRQGVVQPGEAIYQSLSVSAGLNGWDLADPGNYTVQLAIELGAEHVISNLLRLRVAPPRNWDEEYVAQDLLSQDVGRVLAFDGSRYLNRANDVLREVADRLPDRRIAIHAGVALAMPQTRAYKELRFPEGEPQSLRSACVAGAKVVVADPEEEAAEQGLSAALMQTPESAVESLGHIRYKSYNDRFSAFLGRVGKADEAGKCQRAMRELFSGRGVHDSILHAIDERAEAYHDERP